MKEIIKNLCKEDLLILKEQITNKLYDAIESDCYHEHDNNHIKPNVCPDCLSSNVVKNGKSPQGVQKYKCNRCKKTRTITRNKLTYSSKKKFNQWARFIESLLAQDSLKVSCEKAKISRSTAFRWRIKILKIMCELNNQDILEGIVYLDETLTSKVLKDKNFPYNPNKIKKRGMSNDKISIACAIDDSNNTIIRVADFGRITSKSLINVYDDKIKKQSIAVFDSLRSYHSLMKHLEIEWKKIPSKKKSIDEYDLEPINHLHAQIKDFLYHYKGISMKYLQGYLSLFNLLRTNKRHYQTSTFESVLNKILGARGHIRCADIDNGKVIIA